MTAEGGPSRSRLGIGLNLNNRDALLSETYDLGSLLELSERAEEVGFDSLWVGDSLFSKPRWEPLSLLAALSQRTSDVRLGTACLVASLREPISLALAWATIDQLSGGRLVMGACAGYIEDGVRREFEAVGFDFATRTSRFEEVLHIIRALWSDEPVDFTGRHHRLDRVSFDSGTERRPLRPVGRPPIWIVSNPRIADRDEATAPRRTIETPERRIVKYGDGWMTCCRSEHPDEIRGFRARIDTAAADLGVQSPQDVAYQVTLTVGSSAEQAREEFRDYIAAYYPEFGSKVKLSDWGPAGTPEQIADWIRTFAEAGVTHMIVRFASFEQFEQLARFSDEVLPRLADLRS